MDKIKNILGIISIIACFGCGALDSSNVNHEDTKSADGETGTAGKTGATGDPGAYAAIIDQKGTAVGFYLERVDFDDNRYEILTVDGYRTVLDLDDASFLPPSALGSGLAFSCMYQSNDCSGDCFGIDTRARGYLLVGADGKHYAVDSNAAEIAITAESHNKSTAISACVAQTIVLPNATPTSAYTGILSKSLNTPLIFKAQHTGN